MPRALLIVNHDKPEAARAAEAIRPIVAKHAAVELVGADEGPLPQPAAETLGRAADALSRQDAAAALRLAEEAARIAPAHSEPLEVLLLAHLARGVAGDVRGTIARLAAVDARNPIALAFAGLEAVQNGRDADAVAALAWFVGEGAVARRGAAIPLPTAVGELEEQCALAALRLDAQFLNPVHDHRPTLNHALGVTDSALARRRFDRLG
jgi:hypothetical protein